MNRRNFFATLGCAPLAAQVSKTDAHLDLMQFEPKSMLNVTQTAVERARYPVVDVHAHLSWSKDDANRYLAQPEDLLPLMDRRNLHTLVNLTGGRGSGVKDAVERFDRKHPGRFLTFTEPWWTRVNEPGYAANQARWMEQAKKDGARGVKVLKSLGLTHRDSDGKLIRIDDPRFDPMWDACGRLGLPVAIHVSDPLAFFEPIDRFNERFEELANHPDWSFHGKDFPSNAELLAARDNVIRRHPKTRFIVLHVGNFAENLAHVGQMLDRFPNTTVETGARIGELGRQPRAARKFFDKYQDRILFGTDAVPNGVQTPQQVFVDELYRIYFRFLETEDEYFDYAPAPVPPQGRWKIYGLGLPDQILKKVYYENASRVLGVKVR